MTEGQILSAIGQMWPGPVVNNSSWMFAFGEILHFFGVCLLFGSLLIVDLRLLGFFKQMPVKAALAFLPWAIVGFMINLATGWGFFTADPFQYWSNPAFKMKMLLIIFAGVNALVFTIMDHRRCLLIGPGGETATFTKVTSGLSLVLWTGVLILGRMLPVVGFGTN